MRLFARDDQRIPLSARALGLAAVLFAACSSPAPRERPPHPPLASGDLLFLDLDCGELCDAIEEVTLEQLGVPGPRLSHVGIVEVERASGAASLLEAWPPRVVRTPLAAALARARSGGRYPVPALDERAAEAARRRLGIPYDDDFLAGNGRLYCSELVHEATGRFRPRPMVFGRPGSPARATWERHFRGRGRPVPEGEPGLSPLGIYLEARALPGAAVRRW